MKLPSQPNRRRALTRLDVTVIVAVVLFFAVAIMKFVNGNPARARISCVGRNKQIGLAFRIWANDNDEKLPYLTPINRSGSAGVPNLAYRNESESWLHFLVMSNELGSAKLLTCPTDRERLNNMATDFSTATNRTHYGLQFQRNEAVSYFVGLDADERRPQMLLTGDRHMLTNDLVVNGKVVTITGSPLHWNGDLHGSVGNVTLADGSVLWSAPMWEDHLKNASLATNRLLMPW